VSHHTVKAIREREPELVATEKRRLSATLGHAARLCAESLIDDLQDGKVPANVKSISLGILLDKKAMLDGEPTLRVEHVRNEDLTIERVLAEMKRIPDSTSEGTLRIAEGSAAIGTIGASNGASSAGPDLAKSASGPGGGIVSTGDRVETAIGLPETDLGQKAL
jgi:hypothetical protein